jgi:hypothetical protein
MNDNSPRIKWRKLLLEGAMVVASVYVAIFLQGISDEHAHHQEAGRALILLRGELARDREDLNVIMAAQQDRDVRHRRLDRWLRDVAGAPSDSVAADIHALFSINRTLFPRSASWATMIAAGELNDLDDPELVSRLADFYENRNTRLEYNGSAYDNWVVQVAQTGIPEVWDQSSGNFISRDPIAIARLRGRLAGIHELGLGFISLLEQWREALDSLISEVDLYLRTQGLTAQSR